MSAASSANFNYGFPTPGPQNPTGQDVMNHVFFVSSTEWKQLREEQQFDYIIIGSGFCGYAFAQRVLEKHPQSRILILERGPFFLPEHFQNLPLPYQQTLGGLSETFPWTLSLETHNGRYIKWQHGMVPFFGGRSIMWSAWCPRPTPKEMDGWPEPVIASAHRYYPEAEKLLHVIPANEIDQERDSPSPRGHRPIYGVIQEKLFDLLKEGLNKIPSATRVIPAPLAVGAANLELDFQKYAVPGPLLELADKQSRLAQMGKGADLKIATECRVESIVSQNGKATALNTSRGVVSVGEAEVVLAMGTIPATTLVLNSFPQVKNAGGRFTAHFISAIVARIPRKDYDFNARIGELELAAIYLAGVDKKTGGQYHIQMTALSDRNPVKNAQLAARHMPDVVATASMEQLITSEDYIVFVCAVLGEMNHRNKDSWLRLNGEQDPLTNVTLQATEDDYDASVWNTMDEGTYQSLEKVLSPKGPEHVEYWHPGVGNAGEWRHQRPSVEQIRVPGLVHEGSTMWIGEDKDSVVGLDYRPRGVENVSVTGGSLWPASGSWNPTLTMVALAQHLADMRADERLEVTKKAVQAGA
ncbi:MAG TPA: GMC oxidoreductase [Candidatus Angelobacter sp.]|nr:GMC oxidoreductase [Candidatus Angelobacter sp.]